MTTPLTAFHAGFHDGYNHAQRKRNQGGHYLTAYKRGAEARARTDNGGEDMPVIAGHRKTQRKGTK